jgi:hypothetical protein
VNTFAVLLLAFPFYLAVNGKLIAYTSLTSKAAATAASPAPQSNTVQPIPSVN